MLLLLVQVGTLYLVRTDLNCSSVASVRTPVGSKWVRLTLNPASDRYCRNLFSLRTEDKVLTGSWVWTADPGPSGPWWGPQGVAAHLGMLVPRMLWRWML